MENYRVVLAERPGANGTPSTKNFRYEACELDAENLKDNMVGVFLSYNLWLFSLFIAYLT